MPQSRLDIVLQAYDKMTAPINSAVNKAQGKLTSFAQKTDKLANKAYHSGKEFTAAGFAVAAPLVAVTKLAMDFEDAMADVAKVANMDRASEDFKKMGAEVLKTSEYLGTSGENVAQLYSALKAGGTATSDLGTVAKIAGEASVAFDMSQEAAGEAFMTMQNALGQGVEETKKAFDATNALTNNFGGKASDMLNFMSNGGASVARTLKVAAPEMEAFGRALMSQGVTAGEAGTVMERFRVGLYKNKDALAIFNKAGGGKSGMQAVFAAAEKSGDPFKWFQAHKFGAYSSQMSLLAMNSEKLGKMLEFVSKESNYLNSAQQEFTSRTSTTSFKLEQAKVAFQNTAIKAGTVLLPTITKLIQAITPLIEKFSKWVEKNPQLVERLAKTAAIFTALALAGGYLSFVVSGVARLFNIVTVGARGFTRVVGFLTDKQKGLSHWIFVARYRMLQLQQFTTGKALPALKQAGNYIGGGFKNAFNSVSTFVTGKALPALKSFGSFIGGGFTKAVKFGGMAWQWLGRAFMSNPIGFVLGAIAIVATVVFGLLIKKFGSVRGALNALGNFFKKIGRALFAPIINAVRPVINLIGAIIDKFAILKKAAQAVKGFFSMIFGGSKNTQEPIAKVAAVTQEVRDHLPSSPAKKGALKDINKVDLFGTIAKTMQTSPMMRVVKGVTGGVFGFLKKAVLGPSTPQTIGATAAMTANFNIYLNGSATKQDANMLRKEIEKCITDLQKKQARVGFA